MNALRVYAASRAGSNVGAPSINSGSGGKRTDHGRVARRRVVGVDGQRLERRDPGEERGDGQDRQATTRRTSRLFETGSL